MQAIVSNCISMAVRVRVSGFFSRRPIDLQRVASALCPRSLRPYAVVFSAR